MSHEAEASADEQLLQSLADIEEFLRDNDAASFLGRLRPGASEAALAAAESRVRAPLGALRLLYRWHDGQRIEDEREPLFEHMFFLALEDACDAMSTVVECYVEPPSGVSLAKYHRSTQGFDADELASTRWLPFANTEGDYLAVHLPSGKVARMLKGDLPWLRLEAPDLGAFLGAYASALWDGHLVMTGDPAEPGVVADGLRCLGRYYGRA